MAGATLENEAAQNLRQQRAPMTIEQWSNLLPYQQIGDFWVVDHTTGWAYWASLLEPGKASSYLLDAAELTEAIEDTVFNGSYYYGIHVDSQLISPDNSEEFLPGGDSRLEAFLTGIKNNSMNESGTSNPRFEVDSPPSALNFDTMLPGRVFTMAGEQYRYLEDQGSGNHMIIRHDSLRFTTFNEQPQVLSNWFSGLDAEVQAMVQPVSIPAVALQMLESLMLPWGGGFRWLPAEWEDTRFDIVRADRTVVNSSGTPQAFALSLADVVHLSTETGPFPNYMEREGGRVSWWWLRTLANSPEHAWVVHAGTMRGWLGGGTHVDNSIMSGGVRPALIINQSN
ncbi:MAG: hypothetical protein ACRCR5_02000 [Lactococcus garvieae]